MEKVRLGKTGLMVSRVGMGGIPLIRPPFNKAVKVIKRALDLGINLIDTSPGYDDSELRIGRAIAGRRDDIVIVTKTSWRSKEQALKLLKTSLRQLNTNYIDVWLLQNVSTFEAYETCLQPDGALSVAREAKEAGKILNIGISSHSLAVAQKAVASDFFELVMFPFNFVTNHAEEQLVQLTKNHNVGFLAMKPFAGGQLVDADLAIKYLLQFNNVVPLPGIETIENIEEIVDVVKGSWKLTTQDWQRIEDIRAKQGSKLCMWCEYCKPCPLGINIPWVMNIESMWILWGAKGFRKFFLDFIEQAKACDRCGECEEKCPYQLNIMDTLAEQIEFYEREIKNNL